MSDMLTLRITQRRPLPKELLEKRIKEGNKGALKFPLLYTVDVLKVKPELVTDTEKRKSLMERIEKHIKKNLVPKHGGGEYIINCPKGRIGKLFSIHF